MQKKFAFATIAVAGLATAASAQTRLSHSLEEFLVSPGVGVACVSTTTGGVQTGASNSFARSFTLADFGISEGFTVNTVEFGIETLNLPTLLEVDITVNLYQVPAGSPPTIAGTLVGSAVVTLGERSAEVITVDVDGSVDAGSALMVEIDTPSFQDLVGGLATGDVLFPGGNSFGENAPSYIFSVPCGLTEYTSYPDIAFPDTHLIIIAEGEVGGGTSCRVDIDGDMALTIFDFLAFQNAFDSGDLSVADFDGDGALTIFDFLTFQNEFDAGCTF